MQNLRTEIIDRLNFIKSQDRYRSISSDFFNHPGYIDLTHNDYLNLRNDKTFLDIKKSIPESYPIGCGASRLLGGEHPSFDEAESSFASYKGSEAALYFTTGYAANEAVGSAFSMLNANIYSDALNHASIIDGIKLGRYQPSNKSIFPHNHIEQLESLLKKSEAKINVIYLESLYSMDGDFAKLKDIYNLCKSYRGVLVIDEAHATGCYGKEGRGLGDYFNLPQSDIISISTLGKAFGCQGAFVTCPMWFREYLINTSRPFIYSTGPSPIMMDFIKSSLNYIKKLDHRRAHLEFISKKLRVELKQKGFDIGQSESHIIPIILKSEQKALRYANKLLEQKILIKAIRPPTVPENACRLRISLHAGIQEEDIETIIHKIWDIHRNDQEN